MLKGCDSLSALNTPCNVGLPVALPAAENAVWRSGDGTELTELPQGLGHSVALSLSRRDENESTDLPSAVKYVPYDTALPGGGSQTYALAEGTLSQGLSLTADGRITGVPAQSGTFAFTVQLTDGSGTSQTAGYTLEVSENTAANFDTYADPGYELTELIPDAYLGELPEEGSQLMVSAGAFEEFTALYLDGVMLDRGADYTAESGSTRITILNQTLRRSGAGTHTLAMEFRTKESGALKWAVQNVVIAEGSSGNGGNDTPPSQEGGDNNQGGGSQEDGADDQEEDGDEAAPVQSTAPTVAYIVKRGGNLWKISTQFYGTGRNWRRIYTDNASVIRDPDRL